LRPVAHFFKEMWSKHYRQPLPDRHISLFQAYDEALCLKEQLTEFSNQENRSASADLLGSLPDSVAWVLRHADDSLIPGAQQTIIHGNLHGDNLFVDGEHALAIDFERTGPGPILRDFVSLEVDILTRLARLPEGDFRVLYELAVMLTTPTSPVPVLGGLSGVPKAILDNREAAKALMVVTGVRRLAHDVTRFCDIREYYWGLLLSALFVAVTAPESAIQCSRALFLAAVVADRLQRFAEEWPPKDWPHVAMIPLRDKEGLEVLRERLLSRLSDLKEQAMEPTRFRSEGILRLQKELNTVDLELSLHLFWQQ